MAKLPKPLRERPAKPEHVPAPYVPEPLPTNFGKEKLKAMQRKKPGPMDRVVPPDPAEEAYRRLHEYRGDGGSDGTS